MPIPTAENEGDILKVTVFEQYRTVDELFKRSKANSVYYTLLVLSVLIITSGLLLNNGAIVIGGMLVTPMFTPILGEAIANNLVSTVINIGVKLGSDFIFKSMNIDPTLANIGSALLSGAVLGGIMPGGDIGLTVYTAGPGFSIKPGGVAPGIHLFHAADFIIYVFHRIRTGSPGDRKSTRLNPSH